MAQLHCHCSTAFRLGAKPAPAPALFPLHASYVSIIDEEGRLWLWLVEEDALKGSEAPQSKPVG